MTMLGPNWSTIEDESSVFVPRVYFNTVSKTIDGLVLPTVLQTHGVYPNYGPSPNTGPALLTGGSWGRLGNNMNGMSRTIKFNGIFYGSVSNANYYLNGDSWILISSLAIDSYHIFDSQLYARTTTGSVYKLVSGNWSSVTTGANVDIDTMASKFLLCNSSELFKFDTISSVKTKIGNAPSGYSIRQIVSAGDILYAYFYKYGYLSKVSKWSIPISQM
jgi:hypothetical protein